jgi:glycosyltransferase involved in cell wall biosynthesis
MRVAIVHDVSLVFGGAERVLYSLLKMYPHADVYIAFVSAEYSKQLKKVTSGTIYVSPWNRYVHTEKYAKYFKPLIMWWWRTLDLSRYDVVIASSHSYSSKSVNPPKNVPLIAYIHTPPRYLWNIYNETQWIHYPLIRQVVSPMIFWLRNMDFESAQRPNILIANSIHVQKRIMKYYHRKSIVIYPPATMPKSITRKSQDYYVCVSRLVKQKRIDTAIHACNEMHASLKIVGIGDEERALRRIAGPTIQFLGFVSDENMPEIYAHAKALIFLAKQEDLGLSAIEAMSYGVPVIASADGGSAETIIDGKTGIVVSKPTKENVILALRKLELLNILPTACRKRAMLFSEHRFQQQMNSAIYSVL